MSKEIEALIAELESLEKECSGMGRYALPARIKSAIISLRQQRGHGEPVAWIDKDSLQHLIDDGVSGYGYSLRAKGIYGTDVPLFTSPPAPAQSRELSDAQIKHMVDRFLGWRLPEHFNPDCGISFKPDPRWTVPMRPVGTNLFSADQAEQMVRYLVEGMPITADRAIRPAAGMVSDSISDEMIDDLDEVADWLFDQISGHTEYIGRDAGLGQRGRAVQLVVKRLRSMKDLALGNKATGG